MNVDDLSDKEKQQKYNEIIFRSYVQKIVDKKYIYYKKLFYF